MFNVGSSDFYLCELSKTGFYTKQTEKTMRKIRRCRRKRSGEAPAAVSFLLLLRKKIVTKM